VELLETRLPPGSLWVGGLSGLDVNLLGPASLTTDNALTSDGLTNQEVAILGTESSLTLDKTQTGQTVAAVSEVTTGKLDTAVNGWGDPVAMSSAPAAFLGGSGNALGVNAPAATVNPAFAAVVVPASGTNSVATANRPEAGSTVPVVTKPQVQDHSGKPPLSF